MNRVWFDMTFPEPENLKEHNLKHQCQIKFLLYYPFKAVVCEVFHVIKSFMNNQIIQCNTRCTFIFQSRKPHGFKREPQFTEKYFSQTLDHFNFNSMGNGTFNQRYLITGESNFTFYI